MTTPAMDFEPSDLRVETDAPSTLAGVLAQHGMDPAYDSRFHMQRSRPARVDGVSMLVQAGLGLTMALAAAAACSGSPVSWTVAVAIGLAAIGLSFRLRGDEAGTTVTEIILAVVAASALALLAGENTTHLAGIGMTPIAALSACIAIGGGLLVASALLMDSAKLRQPARIAVPVVALAATLAVA